MTKSPSVEQVLHNELLSNLDLSAYTQVPSGTSVRETVQKMRVEGHNCAFITRGDSLIGIFTDRDVLREVADRPQIWEHAIDELMTHNPQTVKINQTTGDALRLMDELHFRNVPVLTPNGKIAGNLTFFALIRYLADLYPEQVYNLPPTPDHFGQERHGG